MDNRGHATGLSTGRPPEPRRAVVGRIVATTICGSPGLDDAPTELELKAALHLSNSIRWLVDGMTANLQELIRFYGTPDRDGEEG